MKPEDALKGRDTATWSPLSISSLISSWAFRSKTEVESFLRSAFVMRQGDGVWIVTSFPSLSQSTRKAGSSRIFPVRSPPLQRMAATEATLFFEVVDVRPLG